MPNKKQIMEKAIELWRQDRVRANDPSFDITPELSELREGGYLCAAQSELMRNLETKHAEWQNYNESLENSVNFQFDTKEAMQTTSFISGSRGVGKSDLAMYAVDQLSSEGVICVVFDLSLDWLKRSSVSRYITVKPNSVLEIPQQNVIVDMSMLTPNQQQQIVESFCQKLFQRQLNSDKRFYLVFEESQIFFPLNSLRSKKTQNSMRILTTGRNFNVSICAISQFPALIDKELVKHAQQVYVGCSSEPNTLAYWRGILGKNAEQLKALGNGEFLYYCRNKLSRIEIEPYENSTPKTRIAIPERSIEPLEKPKQQVSIKPILSLVTFLFWCGIALYAISQMRW